MQSLGAFCWPETLGLLTKEENQYARPYKQAFWCMWKWDPERISWKLHPYKLLPRGCNISCKLLMCLKGQRGVFCVWHQNGFLREKPVICREKSLSVGLREVRRPWWPGEGLGALLHQRAAVLGAWHGGSWSSSLSLLGQALASHLPCIFLQRSLHLLVLTAVL